MTHLGGRSLIFILHLYFLSYLKHTRKHAWTHTTPGVLYLWCCLSNDRWLPWSSSTGHLCTNTQTQSYITHCTCAYVGSCMVQTSIVHVLTHEQMFNIHAHRLSVGNLGHTFVIYYTCPSCPSQPSVPKGHHGTSRDTPWCLSTQLSVPAVHPNP